MKKDDKSIDLLGIKPVAEATNVIAKGTVEGIGAFLGRICLPAAEEFGLLLKDKVSNWRATNAVKIAKQAENILLQQGPIEGKHAHPRLVMSTIEHGSWANDDYLQNAWAGLLASSCTLSGDDDGNLMFINILSQLTSSQVKIFNHACIESDKRMTEGGWIAADVFKLDLIRLQRISGTSDFQRIDRELDHLRSVEILDSGFPPNTDVADLTPTSLGLHMYVRCQGYSGSPLAYFKIKSVR